MLKVVAEGVATPDVAEGMATSDVVNLVSTVLHIYRAHMLTGSLYVILGNKPDVM